MAGYNAPNLSSADEARYCPLKRRGAVAERELRIFLDLGDALAGLSIVEFKVGIAMAEKQMSFEK